eukprot:TRINITY_DN6285_c0_g1_i3.p1 TRINITY_DN6285_c0_g1~~TRINITY_DN6285_c0_g1_i3.p1  ORF type:complete len:208 (-),score=20.90 TRINITY_DN6285_c0_g1_i3:7-630(-)
MCVPADDSILAYSEWMSRDSSMYESELGRLLDCPSAEVQTVPIERGMYSNNCMVVFANRSRDPKACETYRPNYRAAMMLSKEGSPLFYTAGPKVTVSGDAYVVWFSGVSPVGMPVLRNLTVQCYGARYGLVTFADFGNGSAFGIITGNTPGAFEYWSEVFGSLSGPGPRPDGWQKTLDKLEKNGTRKATETNQHMGVTVADAQAEEP